MLVTWLIILLMKRPNRFNQVVLETGFHISFPIKKLNCTCSKTVACLFLFEGRGHYKVRNGNKRKNERRIKFTSLRRSQLVHCCFWNWQNKSFFKFSDAIIKCISKNSRLGNLPACSAFYNNNIKVFVFWFSINFVWSEVKLENKEILSCNFYQTY